MCAHEKKVSKGLPPKGETRDQNSEAQATPVTYPCAKPHHHLHHPSPQSTLAALIQCLHKTLGSNDSHETKDHPMSLHTLLSPTAHTTFHR